MNKGIVFDGKEAELEVRRDDLIRRIEMLIDKGGDAKLAIELTIEASRISKELGYCKDIELVRSGASTSPKKNPTYMNAELERKRLLNEVAPLIRSGNTDDATKMIEEAGKLTGEWKNKKIYQNQNTIMNYYFRHYILIFQRVMNSLLERMCPW